MALRLNDRLTLREPLSALRLFAPLAGDKTRGLSPEVPLEKVATLPGLEWSLVVGMGPRAVSTRWVVPDGVPLEGEFVGVDDFHWLSGDGRFLV